MDVAAWLRDLDLDRYAPAFREHEIDWEVLPKLTSEDLREIGVAAIGHRRKLLDAIAALAAASPEATATTPSADTPARSEAERRQLTVMFCDLVGSTALSTRHDPEDLRELIGDYHRAVSDTVGRFDGFVAKYMGDGVLIYFGYPQAHEDDAERAVRAGLAVIEAVGKLPAHEDLSVRLGVATGLAVVGDLIGEGAAQERGVVGETPNLAARLQGLAAPNTLVIAEATRRQIGGLFDLADLGSQALAGFAGPQPAWRVIGESGMLSRFEALRSGTAPLVGRAEELDLLLCRWQQAKAGEGGVVLLSGEPGIGKSRLTAALNERIADEPHTRLRYFCSPYHQETAFHPVIVQLGHAAGFARDDTDQEKLVKLRALLGSGSRDEEIALVADLLSVPDPAGDLNLSPRRKRERLFAALLHQLEALAQHRPVLAIFEDVHWVDPTSRELLDLMVDRVSRQPVLLIITFRPEFQADWAGQQHVSTLALNRLEGSDGAVLVESLAGTAGLARAIVEDIVERADGVPLFIEELTRAVLESGDSNTRVAALLSASGLPDLAVPATLRASLLARLDRLGSAARETAQVGAVLGREFTYDLIREAAQRREGDLQASLGRLTDAGLLYCRGTAPDATYLFKHALIQEAAYEALLRSRRRELHGRVARMIAEIFPQLAEAQPAVLARHWAQAGDTEAAIAAWRKAGDGARARNAHIEAREAYRQALLLLTTLPESPQRDTRELELLGPLGAMIYTTEGYTAPKSVELNARTRELAEKSGNLARLVLQTQGAWLTSLVAGDLSAAASLADRMSELAERDGADLGLGMAVQAQLLTRMYRGDLLGAEDHFTRGERLVAAPGFRQALAAFEYTFGNAAALAWLLGNADEARRRSRRSLAGGDTTAYKLAVAQMFAAGLQVFIRRPEEVAKLVAQTIALCDERGFRDVGRWAQPGLGWARAQMGFAEEGAALLGKVVAAASSDGALLGITLSLTLQAEAQMLAGSVTEALATIDEALTINPVERYVRPEALRLRGEMRCRHGDAKLAESDFREATALAQEMNAKAWELRAATSLARLCGAQDRRAEARDLLAPVYGWFTEGFDTPDLVEAQALLDELR